jgi:hypothetical protein
MLADLQASTYKFSFKPAGYVATVRTNGNTLAYLDVFVDEGTTDCFVYLRGRWERTEGLAGLERFDAIKTKKLYDTATNEVIDTGVLVGS